MVSSSENSKSPFRGLECLRPFKRGERYVAVATKKLYAQIKPWVSCLARFQEPLREALIFGGPAVHPLGQSPSEAISEIPIPPAQPVYA